VPEAALQQPHLLVHGILGCPVVFRYQPLGLGDNRLFARRRVSVQFGVICHALA
jgi:hypothetical protein